MFGASGDFLTFFTCILLLCIGSLFRHPKSAGTFSSEKTIGLEF